MITDAEVVALTSAMDIRRLEIILACLMFCTCDLEMQVQDIQPKDVRKMLMAKEATYLHFAIRNKLMYVRGSKKLLQDVKASIEAQEDPVCDLGQLQHHKSDIAAPIQSSL
jgi:hypothetical protein